MACELACEIRFQRRCRGTWSPPLMGSLGDAELFRCMQPTLGDDMDHASFECEHSLLGRTCTPMILSVEHRHPTTLSGFVTFTLVALA